MSLFSGQAGRRANAKRNTAIIAEEDPGEDYLGVNILSVRLGHSPGPLSILIKKWVKMGCKLRVSRDPFDTHRKTYCLSDVKKLYALRPDLIRPSKRYRRTT